VSESECVGGREWRAHVRMSASPHSQQRCDVVALLMTTQRNATSFVVRSLFVRCSFVVRSLFVRCSLFVRPSSFVVYRLSSFVVYRLSFVVRCSSFVAEAFVEKVCKCETVTVSVQAFVATVPSLFVVCERVVINMFLRVRCLLLVVKVLVAKVVSGVVVS